MTKAVATDQNTCDYCKEPILTESKKDHLRMFCKVNANSLEEELFRGWVAQAKHLSTCQTLPDEKRFIAKTVFEHVKENILKKQVRN